MIVPKFFDVENPHSLRRIIIKKTKNIDRDILVDIIIPVYKGFSQTKTCINSVLRSNIKKKGVRIIIIDDCSPDKRIKHYLNSITTNNQIMIYTNKINKGFTASVNFGMNLSKVNDVVLLNSDTEVCNNWLDKLIWHAYSNKNVGTVTPFSNNATICSYPNLNGFSKFPKGSNLQEFDSVFYQVNKHKNIMIPTAVGFCMYIKRSCLNDIGLFDEKKFGKGYGEENDFCLRATKNGWGHLLAGDTFVYHEGGASFSDESESRKKYALKTLTALYPNYQGLITEHIRKNEVLMLIIPAMIERLRRKKKPKILHILHNLGGGTEKHVKELIDRTSNNVLHFVMVPFTDNLGSKKYQIFSSCNFEKINISLDINKSEDVIQLLNKLDLTLVHVHHTMGYQIKDLKKILKKINVSYYITIHDYMFICPRITLIHPKTNLYCNEPNTKDCNKCITIDRPFNATNITAWRAGYRGFVYSAEKIICPSVDVANRIKRYYPQSRTLIVHHEELPPTPKKIILNPIENNNPIRIAMLGIIAPHKGGELVTNLLDVIKGEGSKYELKLIGFVQDHPTTEGLSRNKLFSSTGRYDDKNLAFEIAKYNPHFIFFASRCPETYSFTLSAAINSGYPILAPNIGAFPERLRSNKWAWLYEANLGAYELLDEINKITSEHIAKKNFAAPRILSKQKVRVEKNFYEKKYLENLI